MKTLCNEPSATIEVKRSKFISYARRCSSLKEAKQLVRETWTLHPDATHVVHGAVVGKVGSLFSCSDDKEPKHRRTSRPEVVKGSGITDICVLVVRYFGGTLLGTGGLVQAYGEAAKRVIALCVTEEMVEKTKFRLMVAYSQYDAVSTTLTACGCTVDDTNFATNVTISGTVPVENIPHLEEGVREATNAQATLSYTNFLK